MFHNKIKCNNKTPTTQIKVIKIKTNINNKDIDHNNKTKDIIQVCNNSNKWAINNNNSSVIKEITVKATNQNLNSAKTKETAMVACTTNKTTISSKEEIRDTNLNTPKEMVVTRIKEAIKIKTIKVATNKETTILMDGKLILMIKAR
jgi:hypothetical protein